MVDFTVLMSLYDKERKENLECCLRSLSEQTLLAKQTICVFDGFIKEELRDVVLRWQDKLNIKIIELKENVGLGQALNIGLSNCDYELVARMDTDDICEKNRFHTQLNFMINNPSIVLCGSYIAEFDEFPEQYFHIRKLPTKNDSIIKYSSYRCPFNHMTVMFRKSIILAVGGYKHHQFMEDYNLWLRLLAAGYETANIPEVFVYARAGDNMLARRKGYSYIKSEFILTRHKINLGMQKAYCGYIIFILRVLPRLLPITILKGIYKYFLRSR